MARSTEKQINKMLDELKIELGLKSRAKSSVYFYSVIAYAFKKGGVSLSYYLNGCYTLTNDHMTYKEITFDELFTPRLTIKKYF